MFTRGFTLLELLITLVILTLLVTVGVPSLSQQVRDSQTKTQMLDLFQAVQLTRTQAINANSRATLRHLGNWNQGWQLFLDPNHNGILDEGETLIAESGPVGGLRIEGNQPLQNYVSFIGTGEGRYATGHAGGAFQAGTLTVCPEGGGEGYELVLARSGRMRIQKMDGDRC